MYNTIIIHISFVHNYIIVPGMCLEFQSGGVAIFNQFSIQHTNLLFYSLTCGTTHVLKAKSRNTILEISSMYG